MSNFEAIPCNYTHKRRAKTPSFSSILLDSIYRSIDADGDGGGGAGGDTLSYHHHDYPTTTTVTTPINSHMTSNYNCNYNYDCSSNYLAGSKQRRSRMRSHSTFETVDLRQAIMIESWMEKHEQQPDHMNNVDGDVEKIRIVRQKSVPTKSTVSDTSSSTSARNFSKIRANLASRGADSCFAPTTKPESSSRIFRNTKSRAMKMYGDLKKPKSPQNQPISPGARIAAFINSIFRNSGDRKPNPPPPAASSTSACSSASSFSRSCLIKAPSSRGKSRTSTARSVRFYPVSIILDEDSRPCGHKSLHKEDEASKIENNRNQSNKGRREKEIDTLMKMIKGNCRDRRASERFVNGGGDDSDEAMNDGESCASSDLFELENLSAVGVSRYAEELPVYATTSLHKIKG